MRWGFFSRSRLRPGTALAVCALVLVSACFGAVAFAASNDMRASATHLAFGTPDQVDTSGYTVESGEPNTTPPFNQQCGTDHPVGVARTAWYRFRGTGHPVIVSTEGSSYDTALFVYSPSGSLMGCNDDVSATDLQSSLRFRTTRGATYEVQIGRACNATGPPVCSAQPAGGTLRVTATDIPPHPQIAEGTHFLATFSSAFTTFDVLYVDGAPPGSTITLLCSPRHLGCPLSRTRVHVRSGKRVQLATRLHHAHLKPGAQVSVRVTKRGFVGALTRLTVRRGQLPRKQVFCLEPGSTKPRRVCG